MSAPPLLDIRKLCIGFRGRSGRILPVLHEVDLTVCRGESLGIVGESGSGKSTLALAAMGYLKHGLVRLSGEVIYNGSDTFALSAQELSKVRGGQLGLIPQNSGQALTPTLRIGKQINEALRLHCDLPESAYAARALDLLTQVRLPDPQTILRRYPHELSGGQQQRVAIAMALAGEPDALLLDEPTTGLDVTTQAHILDLLRDLASARNMAMVYVSHDLGVIARVCDRIQVLYAGETVLTGPTRSVLSHPAHPYARGLLASIPRLGDSTLPRALEGRPPGPESARSGCAFAPRCAMATETCQTTRPPMVTGEADQMTRCHYPDEVGSMRSGHAGAALTCCSADSPLTLSLDSLAICYERPGFFARLTGQPAPPATVDGITLDLRRGETLGLVGESGSGKSTILKSIAGLLAPAKGRISLDDGTALPSLAEDRRPDQLRRIQMIFQNPDDSLNPRQTVGEILAQPLRLYFGLKDHALRDRATELLETVRLGAHYLDRRPGQLSGGEKQRVAVARAFAAGPDIVLCDEITSALDVSVQAAVLELLNDLKGLHGTAFVFVSHDLTVVRALSDRVAVLYQGRICEMGPAAAVYAQPSHPYTEALLGAVLEPDPDQVSRLLAEDAVELSPPARGCPFQRRCPVKRGTVCETDAPPAQEAGGGHVIHCHIPLDELRGLGQQAQNS
ncbi:ABC transporter ATP-binding protein [uncultured Roseovarius sp.]|uniref:ABC transporter ATP-binding protein n=1 Tax=uncultured Roseovarius sp. TaxID=293344 RepID=UPI000C586329|nr:ABC transporter ATP-binding protein [Roseovarius sp.]MBD12763.1 ABC transporter ATP-binding protein [Roseovarius sp.]|tara:strand:+ start:887 stop:2923 length:2037 start_codon:yes stop_codon:yes gene_type:complete